MGGIVQVIAFEYVQDSHDIQSDFESKFRSILKNLWTGILQESEFLYHSLVPNLCAHHSISVSLNIFMAMLVKPVRLCDNTPFLLCFVPSVSMHSNISCQEIVLQLHIKEIVTVGQLYPHIICKYSIHRFTLLDELRGDRARCINLFCLLRDLNCRWWHLITHT